MPLDDCLWLHDDKDTLPASPRLPQDGPQEPIQSAQGRPGPFPFEDGRLLAGGEYFERLSARPRKKTRAAARNASTNDTTF